MFGAFFSLGMVAINRQLSFRWFVLVHVLCVSLLALLVELRPRVENLVTLGQMLLSLSIVEGAMLIGWRLTQIPKSQSLEFLLVSPVHPRPMFLAEALVGISRVTLITLSGLPVLLVLVLSGHLVPVDVLVLLGVPLTWGLVTGLGLTMWAYEPQLVRRIGEILAIIAVSIYLIIGILAGERLGTWLESLPPEVAEAIFGGFVGVHDYNPFGVLVYWFLPWRDEVIAAQRLWTVELVGLGLLLFMLLRAASRLRAHFHERHYRPISSKRPDETSKIGDRPLAWWAVRRVMEYSGRVNIYMAGAFGLLYATYVVAGDSWPSWMGRGVFIMFERMGGAPMLITGLVILAAVPAAFQYGLWDSGPQERAKRLELLLLTDLNAWDYWQAARTAALCRGRGYMVIAVVLILAMLWSGQANLWQGLAGALAGVLLWSLAFAMGFRAFGRGSQSSGIGTLLTLGFPLMTVALLRLGYTQWAPLVPPGAVYTILAGPVRWTWLLGPCLTAVFTVWVSREALKHCDRELRQWMSEVQRR